jgi:hypothetical protein
MDEDRALDGHLDQSAVTFNVNLGGDFDGGRVAFADQRDRPRAFADDKNNGAAAAGEAAQPLPEEIVYKASPRVGYALVHAGQHWHRAEAISRGERHNLILWARSRQAGSSPAQTWAAACGGAPPAAAAAPAAEDGRRPPLKLSLVLGGSPAEGGSVSGSVLEIRMTDKKKNKNPWLCSAL